MVLGAGTATAFAAPTDPVTQAVPLPQVPQVELPVPVPVPVPAPVPAPAPVPSLPVSPPAGAPSLQAAPAPAPSGGGSGAQTLGRSVRSATEEVLAAPEELATPDGRGGAGGGAEPGARGTTSWRRGERAYVKRVRRSIRPYRDCVPALPRRAERILRLHLGLGDARQHSRRTVARRLGISTRRVNAIERRAVTALRRGCPGGDGSAASETGTGFLATSVLASFTGDESGGDGDGGEGQAVAGVRESGGEDGDDGSGGVRRERSGPFGFVPSPAEDLRDIALIVAALLGAAFLLGLLLLHRKGALERPAWFTRSGR